MATTLRPLFRRLGLLLSLSLLTTAALAERQDRYRVVEIGALGAAFSYANGLNDAGAVVGNVQYRDGHLQAFYWDAAHGTVRIDPEAEESSALSINNKGQISGAAQIDGIVDAVIWQPNLTRESIAWAPFGAFATSVNDKGQAVGYREDGIFFVNDRAFAWPARDHLSAWTDLFDNSSDSFATDINNRGQVVGYVDRQAFLANPNGTIRILAGAPFTGLPAFAVAINDTGNVLVSQVGAAYLFTQNRVVPIGTTAVFPLGLNDGNQVVGYVQSGGRHAFVWDSKLGLQRLDNLLVTPGWQITTAAAINKSGMIAGQGTHNGRTRAVLLVPVKSPGSQVNP